MHARPPRCGSRTSKARSAAAIAVSACAASAFWWMPTTCAGRAGLRDRILPDVLIRSPPIIRLYSRPRCVPTSSSACRIAARIFRVFEIDKRLVGKHTLGRARLDRGRNLRNGHDRLSLAPYATSVRLRLTCQCARRKPELAWTESNGTRIPFRYCAFVSHHLGVVFIGLSQQPLGVRDVLNSNLDDPGNRV